MLDPTTRSFIISYDEPLKSFSSAVERFCQMTLSVGEKADNSLPVYHSTCGLSEVNKQ